ncbi:DUF4232 domain-containing protein [Streptomyces sp. NPDC059696]|uniref:DUF4232 domain-containing protein n=1 Tax=Streptomyces sp. NPDC059696 TaxID=3346911 RepID=UPI00369F2179
MRMYHALPAALLAALALTACQDGTGTQDEGAARSEPASATVTAGQATRAGQAPESTQDAKDATSAKNRRATQATENRQASKAAKSGKDTKGGKGAAATRVPCNGSNTTVTAQPVRRPLNHMLITVKNTGSKTCDLTYYPVLRFDEMQWVPQAIEDSQPQAVTTLAPGESGYAGVSLSAADGSGEWGTTGHKLTVGFQGYTPDSDGGPSAIPALPAKGVYYDSTLKVTYWLRDMDDALSY